WMRRERQSAIRHAAIPLAAALAWGLYVRARLGWATGASEVQEVGLPVVGLVRAAEFWPEFPMNMAVGIFVIVLLVLFTRRFLCSRSLVGYVAVGFVPLATLLTRQVWFSYYDITRA